MAGNFPISRLMVSYMLTTIHPFKVTSLPSADVMKSTTQPARKIFKTENRHLTSISSKGVADCNSPEILSENHPLNFFAINLLALSINQFRLIRAKVKKIRNFRLDKLSRTGKSKNIGKTNFRELPFSKLSRDKLSRKSSKFARASTIKIVNKFV